MKRKITNTLLLLFLILPSHVAAYSDYIIASGSNVGIKLNTDGVMVIGTYEVENSNPAVDAGLKTGDIIFSINDESINSIEDLSNIVSEYTDSSVKIGYIRNDIKNYTNLKLYKNKTGLYVKDSIVGIGTLTFIDPNTKKFGALGHEITNSMTGNILDSHSGNIFSSSITSVEPSRNGNPGEKQATLETDKVYGNILENTNKGIFGDYTEEIEYDKLYKVAKYDEINIGNAEILTVINGNEVKPYEIKIEKISVNNDKTRNIIFEITDSELLKATGGIIQGMSGSPIIQGDKIVGAVTHVVVNDPKKGYGILITNMLEEAEN